MTQEYGNAFTQLNDPSTNWNALKPKPKPKNWVIDEATGVDYDYIEADKASARHQQGGLGIGIDRLCMLFADRYYYA